MMRESATKLAAVSVLLLAVIPAISAEKQATEPRPRADRDGQ